MEKMTTISEFIASPALEESIVTNCPEYKEKFSKIIDYLILYDNSNELIYKRYFNE